MKSFDDFRREQLAEQEQLDEIGPAALLAPIKWLGGKAIGDAIWRGIKGTGKAAGNVAGKAVSEVGKTAKKAWDGGENEVSHVKGRDEKGLPKSS